ncbi:hypothetical protein LCGC14_1901370, partial [marine sediment metagenome]
HYYSEIPLGCNYYLLIDPASARKKKSDYTVMTIIAIDSDNNRLIIDGIRDKLDPKQRVDTAISLAQRWEVKGIGWEAIAFQSTDLFYFEEKRRKLKGIPTVEEIKSQKVSKEDRVRGLLPSYVNGKWLWAPKGVIVKQSKFSGKSYDFIEDLEKEFLSFPLGAHDDILDTQTFLSLMKSVYRAKPLSENKEPTEMTYGEISSQVDEEKRFVRKNPWAKFDTFRVSRR